MFKQNEGAIAMIDWNEIDTVFLDMDGTLLDLHFDNYFWLDYVPRRYAQARGIDYERARLELLSRYRDAEGTLEWYCVDHWSRELGLDIVLLKQEIEHLIAVHPHVVDFLGVVRNSGRRTALVTNAHQKALALKLERTRLGPFFDAVICSHDLGLPKERTEFWERLQTREPFDPQRTLFVDDSLAVLRSAQRFGLRWLLAVLKPDTRLAAREVDEFDAISDFSELLPLSGDSE